MSLAILVPQSSSDTLQDTNSSFVCYYYYLNWQRQSCHRLQGLQWLVECMHICTQSTPSVSALKWVRRSYPTNSLIPLSLLLHHEPLVP